MKIKNTYDIIFDGLCHIDPDNEFEILLNQYLYSIVITMDWSTV